MRPAAGTGRGSHPARTLLWEPNHAGLHRSVRAGCGEFFQASQGALRRAELRPSFTEAAVSTGIWRGPAHEAVTDSGLEDTHPSHSRKWARSLGQGSGDGRRHAPRCSRLPELHTPVARVSGRSAVHHGHRSSDAFRNDLVAMGAAHPTQPTSQMPDRA